MPQASDAVWLPVLPDMSGFGPGIVKGADKEADRAGKSFGGKFGKAALAGTAVLVGGAGLAVKALYEIGETFDDVSDTIRVGTGATGDQLAALTDSAKEIGRNVPAEYDKIGQAVADVNTRLGLTGPTLETFTSQVLELGRITGEEVDINTLSASLTAFRIEGEATVPALDHLYRVSQATGIGVNELAASVQSSAPAVQQLGFSFEETAALVGNLDKAGLNSSRMMMGMSQALVRLAKDGEEPQAAFHRVTGEIQGFLEQGDKAAAIDLAGKVFGTRNATQFIGALESGTLAMDDLASVAGMTEDTILGAGAETMDFAEQWQLFKNRTLATLEPLASRVFGGIGTLMEQITQGVTAFTAAWTYNDGEVTSSGLPGFMERLGFYARQAYDTFNENVVPVLKDFGNFVTGSVVPALQDMGGWMLENKDLLLAIGIALVAAKVSLVAYHAYVGITTAATKAWNVAQKVLNGTLRANPIGIVITILALLVGAIVLAWQRSETFRAVVTGAWKGIKVAAEATWNWLKGAFQWIKDGLSSLGGWFTARGKDIGFAWDVMRAALGAGWNWINNNVFAPVRSGAGAMHRTFTDTKDKVIGAWTIMRSGLRAGWNWIADNVFEPFRRGLNKVTGWVRETKDNIGSAWDALKSLFRNPINWVIRQVWNGGIVRVFNAVADVLPGVDPMREQPEIRARAKGGYTPKGWTLVGEEGPELVNFTQPGMVYTASQTRRALAGDGVVQRSFTQNNPPHGGVGDWFSDRWEDVKGGARWVANGVRDAAGNVVEWARGGLADAAALVLNPLKSLIRTTLPGGRFGDLAKGTSTTAIDKVMSWIRGKDEEVPTDSGGRSMRGARPYVNNFGYSLADMVGGIRTMQAFNQSMAGGHPAGRAIDFIDSDTKLNRLADAIVRTRGFDRFSYMAWKGRLWSPGQGWRPQGRGYGNDPYHNWHLHAEWFDNGGLLKPGLNMVMNGTGGPERVLTDPQWDALAGAAAGHDGPMELEGELAVAEDGLSVFVDGKIKKAGDSAKRSGRQLTGRR